MLPSPIMKVEAELTGSSTILVKWEDSVKGGPTDGYKVTVWDSSNEPQTINVSSDVSNHRFISFVIF